MLRLGLNIALSLAVLGVCLWLVWPGPDDANKIRESFADLSLAEFWPFLAGYVGLLAVTHFCRAYRWNNLLEPIGARQPTGRLLAISSVGFMAILALPARLGEFVRPALIRRRGQISAAAALGTVAVERIVDGLLVSLFVFGALFSLRGPTAPNWMMPTAYTALGLFSAALVFLGFGLRWPEGTVRTCVRLCGARWVSERLARTLEQRLLELVRGFTALGDRRNLLIFVFWSVCYWTANGFGMWVLAEGLGLGLSVVGALATMGLLAVGISLPNPPGLVGQFHLFAVLGLSLYLPADVVQVDGMTYAIVLHAIQVVWYVGIGALALATRHVSFAEAFSRRDSQEAAP